MKILVLTPDYPKPGHLFSGIFNERSVLVLRELCEHVEVLVPRPYAPPFISSCVPRWEAHALTPPYEFRNGVAVYRPAVPIIPGVGSAFWLNQGAFLWCRQMARKIHQRARFDAILSFGLTGAGGIAWRLGRYLGLPASGWATGGGVRQRKGTNLHRTVLRTLHSLDLVFYQSQELFDRAAELLGVPKGRLPPDRHIVLARGIPQPPILSRTEIRARVRRELGVTDDQVLVLSVGRITREKGAFELTEAISLAAEHNQKITCVMLGANSAFDETTAIQRKLDESPHLKRIIKIVPACHPDKVWEFLTAADLFAFTSHNEGMPNSLLEAMATGLPSIAFAIPPVQEIEAGTGGILMVPPLNSTIFAEAIVRLAASPDQRVRMGEIGRLQVMNRFMIRKNMGEAVRRLSYVIDQAQPFQAVTAR